MTESESQENLNDARTTSSSSASSQPGRKRLRRPILLAILGITFAAISWYLANAASHEAEFNAGQRIRAMGALASMDANREYVASLNTATLKDPEKFNEVMSMVGELKRLNILDLSKSAVTSEQLQGVAQLSNITSIQLNGTAVGDEDIRNFMGMSRLESLYLADSRITDAAVPDIAKLKSLKILDISNNGITDLAALKALPDLTWLVVAEDTPFSDQSIEAIAALPALQRLSVNPQQLSESQRKKLEDAIQGIAIE